MLDKIVSIKIGHYLDLIRFYKPIGVMLLVWPCWFALSLLPNNQLNLIFWYFLFFIGAFFMRSAGCIINDLVDINIDTKIKRTSDRPLASKKISINQAKVFLIILLLLSFVVLIQFKLTTILVGQASLPLIVLYPFMKRYTNWPQLTLGVVFSWGIIIVGFEFLVFFSWDFILLYIGCVFWTLAYDTIYAYQDREEDVQHKIKSTAVIFDKKGKLFVKFFYLIFFLIIGYLSYKTSGNLLSLVVIIVYILGMNILLNKWDIESKISSNYFFKFNNLVGFSCFLFLIVL